jgi:hypothetical protein
MTRLLLLALVAAPVARAADAEPYRIKLVVAVQKHRLLTDIFRDQVSREVRDGLQAALGRLARVSVTGDHALLEAIRKGGLDRALTGHRGRDDFHTHFVMIGLSGAEYEIETGMHDGLTGLPGAVTRKDRTRDRAFVARLAALRVERDLAFTGGVIGEPDAGGLVKVELKGAAADVGKWVKKGDVFTPVRGAGGGVGRAIPYTLLQAVGDPAGGVITCQVWSRYNRD